MARINIPLDAITSRFNISEISEGFRSQSILTRFANLKPISEFFDFKRLSKPNNFGEVQSRVNYNLGYFSSNYAVLALILALYSLLTNFWLLFDIIFVSVSMFIIKKLNGRDLELGFTRLTTSQLYTGVFIIGVPVFLFSGPLSTLLWLIGANGVAILGHASFMDKPIDQAFSEEVV
jgi:PRA1 family protein 1